jgi:hypothetical protein
VTFVVELKKLGLMNGSDTELTLDGGNQRRTLEESTGEGLESTRQCFLVRESIVETDNADIFLSGTLLRFDESGGSVNTDDETASDFGVKGTRVTGLFATEDSAHPGDHFVGGWV